MLLSAASICPPGKPEQSMGTGGWWRHTLWGYSSLAIHYLHTAIIRVAFPGMNVFQRPAINHLSIHQLVMKPLIVNHSTYFEVGIF